MIQYTVRHKHCGATTTIEGYDIYNAYRNSGLSATIWVEV